jgi:hypothetical protein
MTIMATPRALRDGARDFDFWPGRWRVHNEQLKERLVGCTEWETFAATNEAHLLPGGLGNIDHYFTDHWPASWGCRCGSTIPAPASGASTGPSNRIHGVEPPVVGSFASLYAARYSLPVSPARAWLLALDEHRKAAKRAFEAMMTMKKIDIAAIEAARRG